MLFHYSTSVGFQMVEDSLIQVPIKKKILATSALTWMKLSLLHVGEEEKDRKVRFHISAT